MPSPFPGMAPCIERQKWRGFHSAFIPNIAAALTSQVRSRDGDEAVTSDRG